MRILESVFSQSTAPCTINLSLKMAILNILLTVIAVTLHYGESTTRQWFIVPKDSSSECKHYTTGTCSTLQQLSSQLKETKHTSITLTFLPGDHLLTWNMSISGAKEVILTSEQKYHPRITCLQDKGIIKIRERLKCSQLKDCIFMDARDMEQFT